MARLNNLNLGTLEPTMKFCKLIFGIYLLLLCAACSEGSGSGGLGGSKSSSNTGASSGGSSSGGASSAALIIEVSTSTGSGMDAMQRGEGLAVEVTPSGFSTNINSVVLKLNGITLSSKHATVSCVQIHGLQLQGPRKTLRQQILG
jgi:hypothetical protein